MEFAARVWSWLGKEWRDQRAVVAGIFLAVPALTAITFGGFGDDLREESLAAMRTSFLGLAVGLVVFAVAGSLAAGETRRGTMRAVRRLPGALGAAFTAKVTLLAVIVTVIVAWQGLCLALFEVDNGGVASELGFRSNIDGGAVRAMATLDSIAAWPGGPFWLTGYGFAVFALWTLLVSTWLGRSGVAGIGAIVLLAALAVPFFLFFREHPYFFPDPQAVAGWTAAVAALVALTAAAISFVRGQRYGGRPLRPFLLGSAVLVLALGGGYTYASAALQDWLEIDTAHPDFGIYEAHLGADEQHLYVNVYRGWPWFGQRGFEPSPEDIPQSGDRRGTPLQAWVIDLATGARRKVPGPGPRYFTRVPESLQYGANRQLDPVPALMCEHIGVGEQPDVNVWWDALEVRPVRSLPWRVRDRVTTELVRRTLRTHAVLRDAAGRRVWAHDGVLEREGALPPLRPGTWARPRTPRTLLSSPDGYYGWRDVVGSHTEPRVFIDTETAEETTLPPDRRAGIWGHEVLSRDYVLGSVLQKRPGRKKVRHPVLVPLRGGDVRELRNPPAKFDHVIGRNLVLALRGEPRARTLHAWNPLTGADRPIPWLGPRVEGIGWLRADGEASDGRLLLLLHAALKERMAYAVLAPGGAQIRRITDWMDMVHTLPVALLADDSLVVTEAKKRVVRYDPDGSRRVLFPRPAREPMPD